MSESTMNRTALIFGATGAVGKELLKDVLKHGSYAKVVSVGRRQVQLDDSIPQDKLVQKTIDFENLEAHREDFRNVNDVFCCLGTTRAETGSNEKFKKIDQEYVVDSARLIAEENKPTEGSNTLAPVHYLYCSSMGSNKDSMFLYPRTKGETEEALSETGFERVSIFKPGFLKPVEPRAHFRLSEYIGLAVFTPIDRLFGLGGIISVHTVGKAMHKVAEDISIKPADTINIQESRVGTFVSRFLNSDIQTIGGGNTK